MTSIYWNFRVYPRIAILACINFVFLLMIIDLNGQHLSVNDYGGSGTSFFIDKIIQNDTIFLKPTKPNAGLDITDLNSALNECPVVILNKSGNVSFVSGLFVPEMDHSSLTIVAMGNVKVSFGINSSKKIHIHIYAGKDVIIDGPGINSNGGNIFSSGKKLQVSHSGISSHNGDITLCHLDSVKVTGNGIVASTGNLILDGQEIWIQDNGIMLQNGDCVITSTSDVLIEGNGIVAKSFASSGRNLKINDSKIEIMGGYTNLSHTGLFHISGKGIYTHSGNLDCKIDGDFNMKNGGLSSEGGSINIRCTKGLEIFGEGVRTSGGDLLINAGKDLLIQNGGIVSGGGDITLNCHGYIKVYGEGIDSGGGNLYCHANKILVGDPNTKNGSGIRSKNGNIDMELSSNLVVLANGISSGKGNIKIISKGTINVSQGGISTDNGDIYVHAILGKIYLDGFNLNSNNGKKTGHGVLDTLGVRPGSVFCSTEPVLGGGDITIKTVALD